MPRGIGAWAGAGRPAAEADAPRSGRGCATAHPVAPRVLMLRQQASPPPPFAASWQSGYTTEPRIDKRRGRPEHLCWTHESALEEPVAKNCLWLEGDYIWNALRRRARFRDRRLQRDAHRLRPPRTRAALRPNRR